MSLFGPNSVFNINRGNGPLGYGVVHPVPSQLLNLYRVHMHFFLNRHPFSASEIYTHSLRLGLPTFPAWTRGVSLTWSTLRMNHSSHSWQPLGPWQASFSIRQFWTQARRGGGGGELWMVSRGSGTSGGVSWYLLKIPWRKLSGEYIHLDWIELRGT